MFLCITDGEHASCRYLHKDKHNNMVISKERCVCVCVVYLRTYSTARAVPKAILTLVFQVKGLLKQSDK